MYVVQCLCIQETWFSLLPDEYISSMALQSNTSSHKTLGNPYSMLLFKRAEIMQRLLQLTMRDMRAWRSMCFVVKANIFHILILNCFRQWTTVNTSID